MNKFTPVRQQIRTAQLKHGRAPEMIRGTRSPFVRRAELRLAGLTLKPGADPEIDGRRDTFRAFEEAARLSVDAVYFDLEDAEPERPDLAPLARRLVIAAIKDISYGGRLVALRPHGLRSPHFEDDLVGVIEAVGDEVDTVILPGVEGADEVREIQTIIRNTQRVAGWKTPIAIEVEIATPRAVTDAPAIAALEDVSALVFDGPALARTLGTLLDSDSWVWDFGAVRQMLPIVAAAHGKEAIDGSADRAGTADTDEAAVEAEAQAALRHGFAGKRVHDPAHIPVVQAVFTPSREAALDALGRAVAYARTAPAGVAGGREWVIAWGALRSVRTAAHSGVLSDADVARSGFALPELERLVRARGHGTAA